MKSFTLTFEPDGQNEEKSLTFFGDDAYAVFGIIAQEQGYRCARLSQDGVALAALTRQEAGYLMLG